MAYDEALAQRVRGLLDARSDLTERPMFGGLAFLVAGNMACCVSGETLIVRAGDDADRLVDSEPGAGLMEMRGRPMRGWLRIAPEAANRDLERWVAIGEGQAAALPPK